MFNENDGCYHDCLFEKDDKGYYLLIKHCDDDIKVYVTYCPICGIKLV